MVAEIVPEIAIMTEIATVNKKLVVSLQAKCAIHSSHRGRNRATSRWGVGAGDGDGAGTGTRSAVRTGAGYPTLEETASEVEPEPPTHYCWKCSPGCRQNSAKFTKPAAGHIRDMQVGAEAPK